MKAVVFVGGGQGHKPTDVAQWCSDLLMADGYDVKIYDTLVPLEQPETGVRAPGGFALLALPAHFWQGHF